MAGSATGHIFSTTTMNSSVLVRSLMAHSGIGMLVVAHTVTALFLSAWIGRELNYKMAGMVVSFCVVIVPIFIFCLLIFEVSRAAVCERPKSPLRHLGRRISAFVGDAHCMVDGLIMMAIVFLFMSSFSLIKDSIPDLAPFNWDRTFFQLDRLVFLGSDPWRVSFSVFGSPIATTVLNFFYNVWFFLMYCVIMVMAFCRVGVQRRLTFFYAFVLIWGVGGNLLAILFSSAGPVYFSALGVGSEYESQFALLREHAQMLPVWALHAQDELWKSYLNGDGTISGISAMPSMHVSSAVLFALLGFNVHRALGLALTAFAVVIMVGSVHLGWHYFVDGVFGGVIAVVCWHAASILAQIDLKRSVRSIKAESR